MAENWIKMRISLEDDPAVIQIANATKLSSDAVIGKLYRIWCVADGNSVDGLLPSVTAEWIDRRIGKRGFAAAMAAAGWLIIEPTGVRLPKFERHNGSSAKARADNSRRKTQARAYNNPRDKIGTNVPKQCDDSGDKIGTREEKRREEKKPPPPTPAPVRASAPDPEPLGEAWGAARDALSNAGVSMADQACRAARDRNATPRDVLNLVEHFERHPGAWSAGLLYAKVVGIHPDQRPNWPEPSAEYQHAKRATEDRAKLEKQLADRKRFAEEREQLERERLAGSGVSMLAEYKRRIAGTDAATATAEGT